MKRKEQIIQFDMPFKKYPQVIFSLWNILAKQVKSYILHKHVKNQLEGR